MKLRLLLLLPVILCHTSYSATTATTDSIRIAIQHPQATDFSTVSLGSNIDGVPFCYMDNIVQEPFVDGICSIKLPAQEPQLISIQGIGSIPTLRFVASPGTTVNIKVEADGKRYKILGEESKAIEAQCRTGLLSPAEIQIPNILDKSEEAAYKILQDEFNTIWSGIKAMCTDEYNIKYTTLIEQEAQQSFLLAITLRLPQNASITHGLLNRFYKAWSPYGKQATYAYYALLNREHMLQRGYATPRTANGNIGLWSNKQAYRNYLNRQDQEHIYAIELIASKEKDSDERYLTKLRFFHDIFPKSHFYTHLDKQIRDRSKADNLSIFGFYDNATKEFVYLNKYPTADLGTIVRKYFGGKPVLVDLWASYCGPCRAEFAYTASLHKWLKEQGVEMLYVSLDQPVASTQWYRQIQEFDLDGFHYFASFKQHDTISKLCKSYLTLPRYMLFDGNGTLVDDNIPRPSTPRDGMVLRILQLLSTQMLR